MRVVLRWSRHKAAFVYPVPPAPRIAILDPWFRSCGSAQVFRGWCAEVEAYRPQAIASTWARLERLLGMNMETLTHSVIVLARRGQPLLTPEQRQILWRAFHVPVFEQIIGENGAVLAAECEAHAGLHIESNRFDAAGRAVETAKCGCGRTTPRLKPAEQAGKARAASASIR